MRINKYPDGGSIVAAPNPAPYRAPLQGLNPAVFRYDVRTAPLDTSPLIQVMQTKDAMDIKREQAAIEREKMKVDLDIAKQKLEHAESKMMMDFYKDSYKMTGGQGLNLNGTPIIDDITKSKRHAEINQPILSEIEALKAENLKIVSAQLYNPKDPQKLGKNLMKIQGLYEKLPTTVDQASERMAIQSFMKVLGGEGGKGMVVNSILGPRMLEERRKYYDLESDNYKPGFSLLQKGVVYNEIEAQKKFDHLVTEANRVHTKTEGEYKKSGITNLKVNKETKFAQDPKLAAGEIADAVLADPVLRSYYTDRFNDNLWVNDGLKTEADLKESIVTRMIPVLQAGDAALNQVVKETSQVLSNDQVQKPETVIRYISEGERTINKKSEYNADINVNRQSNVSGGQNNTSTSTVRKTTETIGQAVDNFNSTYKSLSKAQKGAVDVFTDELVAQGVDLDDPVAIDIVRKYVIGKTPAKLSDSGVIDKNVAAVKKSISEAKFQAQKEEDLRRTEEALDPYVNKPGYKPPTGVYAPKNAPATTAPITNKKTALQLAKEALAKKK